MKKKKTLKYLLITLLVVAFQSCDDFVEVAPAGPDSADYFNSAGEYEDALIGAYDLLQATFWNNTLAVAASDDFGSGGDAFNYDQPVIQNVNYMIQTPADEEQLRSIWQLMYAGLNRVNYLLENKDKTEFAGRDEVVAQAYFLRAYYTFELAKFYGNIPLKVEERNGVSRIADKQTLAGDQFKLERTASIAAVYGLIEEDLKEAIPNLPISQNLAYKVTKGAAQALLGKVYLYHGKFDQAKYGDAATVLNQVISSNKYSLVTGDDYTNLFTTVGENGPESVFEIQYSNLEGAGWECLQCSEGSYFVQFNGPRNAYDIYAAGWGFFLPSQALYDTFDSDDLRRDITILDLREVKALQEATNPVPSVYNSAREDTGFYNQKYVPRKSDKADNASTQELVHKNNYRAIRYADVLLMAAEAEAQSGGTNAADYLNEVRARAYGNNNHEYASSEGTLLDVIFNERRKELAGEGHRFFDLVRTGRAKAAFDTYNANKPSGFVDVIFTVNKNEIFPIPTVELELANAKERWGQNPGYTN